MTVRLIEIGPRAGIDDWLAVPHRVHATDPAYVAQPAFFERKRISKRHAPFATFGEFALFVAYRGHEPVGRISAQVNHQHLAWHADETGHFGFFCCQDDQEAADALIAAAAGWLAKKKLSRMIGPVNFSLNEECGCLVAGFDSPPAILMPHARPFTGRLLERAGLEKAIDLFAYRARPGNVRAYVQRFKPISGFVKGVELRPFDRRRFQAEMELVAAIYADAWQDNWGFVPFARAEIAALTKEMPPLLRNNYARFVLVNGEPIGVIVVLLNINELLTRYRGRLFPFNWLKMLWAVNFERTRTARIPLLGIRRKYQSSPLGGLCLGLVFEDIARELDKYSIEWIEFSWVLETNRRMNAIAVNVSGRPVKTYRLYSKPIASQECGRPSRTITATDTIEAARCIA